MTKISIESSNVLLDVQVESASEALQQLSQTLFQNGYVKASYESAVIAREQEFPTGLPTNYCGVAIPHTDPQHVNDKAIGIAVLAEAVPFVMMGETEATTPVKIILMLAMDKGDAQLTLLQKLMSLFQNDETLATLAEATNKETIVRVIEQQLAE